MPDKEIELAKRLVELDDDNLCPLCIIERGSEKHRPACPFAMAYAILDALGDESKGRDTIETNKMSLRWVEVYNLDDTEHATAIRSTWNDIANFKLQTLVDGKWHDVKIEHNPEDWAVEGTYNTPTEAERHAHLSAEQRERKEKVEQMTDEERSNRATVIEEATELMAENGDDDPLGEQPELSASMEASAAFWEYADSQGIARDVAGKFLQETSSDFDKALELMKAGPRGTLPKPNPEDVEGG